MQSKAFEKVEEYLIMRGETKYSLYYDVHIGVPASLRVVITGEKTTWEREVI